MKAKTKVKRNKGIHAVVDIDRWEVNKILSSVEKHKDDLRHLLIISTNKAGAGIIFSNIRFPEQLMLMEQYKAKVLACQYEDTSL